MLKLFILLLVLNGCNVPTSQDDDLSQFGNNSISGSIEFQNAYSVITNKCAGCHTYDHSEFYNYTNDALWQASSYVSSTSSVACSSQLFYRISGSGCGVGSENMPLFDSLNNSEINTLQVWLESL